MKLPLVILPVYHGLLGALLTASARGELTPAQTEFFEKRIRPVLVEHCQDCHGGKKQKGGLRLDSRAGWQAGGDSGPTIVPGKPEQSLLIKAVHYRDADLAMPPKDKGGQLPAEAIAALEQWIRDGAPDPRESAARIGGMTETEARQWWAFQPVRRPNVPAGSSAIDYWIDARLATASLPPAPLAEPRVFIRRLTYDLTGLPPSPEAVETFVREAAQDRPGAVQRLTERLLASPQYGEHWGRHWLDVVRYTDSLDERGYDKEGDLVDIWRYRDWVTAAFNRDLPYDQFITDQIAGDLLAEQKWDRDQLIATGMYAMGNWGNGDADKEKLHTDIVDDQIDVTGRAFLGLTISCARCHDHKFDPITARDYYGLSGFFFSSRILARFASKGEGERLARWALLSPAEQQRRDAAQKRLTAIDAILSGGLQPLTEFKRDILNRPGLHGWSPKGVDNPSLVINTTEREQAFITIKLPPRAIALHPGPKVAASAAWKSPITGKVHVSSRLRDADPNCGNGIEWEIRHAGTKLAGGPMDNGGAAEVPATAVEVRKDDLLQLIIRPRGEYTCDSTQVDFVIRGDDGTVWDLRETLTSGAPQGHDGVWWICSGEGSRLGGPGTEAATLTEEKQRLTASLANDQFTQGLQEGGIPSTIWEGIKDGKIHQRGRYDRLGETVPRSFPAILAPGAPPPMEGSGRRQLAAWIASPANPLTARVIVNRLWQQHFGEGLVRTENNFGKLGQPPTHPELLDWLASELVRSGWSLKHLQRLIVTSSAYQRAANLPAGAAARVAETDPENRLLSHFPRRRLAAEELRDAMLAVSGELDLKPGGKSTRDLNAPRRTLYVTTIRSNRSDYKSLFDGADSNGVVEQRTESTAAPQALWLMNHSFVLARAQALATQALAQPESRDARVQRLYQRLFSRPPTPSDLALADRALGASTAPEDWQAFCQVLLCSNEFVYVD